MTFPTPIQITAIVQGRCPRCKRPREKDLAEIEIQQDGEVIKGRLCFYHLGAFLKSVASVEPLNCLRSEINKWTGYDLQPLELAPIAREHLEQRKTLRA